MIFNILLCVGDSITYGSRDEKGSSWPFEIESILKKEAGGTWIALNEGKNGETTSNLVRRFYQTVRKYPEAYEICMFEGMNDAKDEISTSPAMYKRNIEHCINCVITQQKKLLLGTIPKQNGLLAPNYSRRTNERINEYNKIIRYLSEKYTIPFVELSDLEKEMYADGIHLSNKGNVETAKRFAKMILEDRMKTDNTHIQSIGSK